MQNKNVAILIDAYAKRYGNDCETLLHDEIEEIWNNTAGINSPLFRITISLLEMQDRERKNKSAYKLP